MSESTREAVRAIAHNEAAFQPLYAKTKGLVWTLCCHVLSNEQDARDAFQNAYLRFLVEIHADNLQKTDFSDANQILYRLTVREARNLRMRRHRLGQREIAMDPLPSHIAPGTPADDLAAQNQLRQQLEALMGLLPETSRLPLQLHYFNGLSQNEIAEILETSQGAVSRRIAKGLKKLEPLARRALLRDSLTALTAMALTGALLQPPAAFSAAVIFAQIQTALAAGAVASSSATGVSVASKTATAIKQTLWTAVKAKPAAAITSAAFIVGVGAILTLGSIRKSHTPAPAETTPVIISSIPAPSDSAALPKSAITPEVTVPSAILLQKQNATPVVVAQVATPLPVPPTPNQAAVTPDPVNASQGAAAQNAGGGSQQTVLHGPWKLEAGNPIYLNLGVICVIGADRTDGNVKLLFSSEKGKLPKDLKFIGYDTEGNSHTFIEVTTSTYKIGAAEKIKYLYNLETPSTTGFQIMSVAITGGDTDLREFLFSVTSDPSSLSNLDIVGKLFIEALSSGDLEQAQGLYITQPEFQSIFTGDNSDSMYENFRKGFNESIRIQKAQLKGAKFVRMDMQFCPAPVAMAAGKGFGSVKFAQPAVVLDNIRVLASEGGSTVTVKLGALVFAGGQWKLIEPGIKILPPISSPSMTPGMNSTF